MVWVKMQLTERPYHDPRTEKVLPSIEGRYNRPGIDPFEGGGKDGYPKFEKSKVREWHEKGTTLLIKADVTAAEVVDANGEDLTDAQAERVKEETFGISPIKSDSGVTK